MMEITLTLNEGDLPCPTCGIAIRYIEMKDEAGIAGIRGHVLICQACAALFLIPLGQRPPFTARSLTQEEKATLRADPLAGIYRQLQRKFEIDICRSD